VGGAYQGRGRLAKKTNEFPSSRVSEYGLERGGTGGTEGNWHPSTATGSKHSRLARERGWAGGRRNRTKWAAIDSNQQQILPDSRVSDDGLGGPRSRTKTTTTASFPDFARERGRAPSKRGEGTGWKGVGFRAAGGFGWDSGGLGGSGLSSRVSGKGPR
jgi:hypothetical protein